MRVVVILLCLFVCGCVSSYEPQSSGALHGAVATIKEVNDQNATIVSRSSFEQSDTVLQNTKTIKQNIGVVEKGVAAQDVKIIQTEKKLDKALDRRYQFITVLCIGAIGVGVFLMVLGNVKMGTSISIASGAMLAVIYAVDALSRFIVFVGGVVALLLVLVIVYFVYVLVIRNRAIEQLVASVQAVKSRSKKECKEDLNIIQSKTTQKIVEQIKSDKQLD